MAILASAARAEDKRAPGIYRARDRLSAQPLLNLIGHPKSAEGAYRG